MDYAKRIIARIVRGVPGASAQYGYHGCHKASIQVFHPGSQRRPLVDWSCRSERWGEGRIDASAKEIVELAQYRLAHEQL